LNQSNYKIDILLRKPHVGTETDILEKNFEVIKNGLKNLNKGITERKRERKKEIALSAIGRTVENFDTFFESVLLPSGLYIHCMPSAFIIYPRPF
jgi:Zn-dependent M32 family carboxypeptidase